MPNRNLHTEIWTEPAVEKWSLDQTGAYARLLAHAESNLCGCWRPGLLTLRVQWHMRTTEQVVRMIQSLAPKVAFDEESGYIWIPDYTRTQAHGTDALSSAGNMALKLPSTVKHWIESDSRFTGWPPPGHRRKTGCPQPSDPDPDPVTESDRPAGSAVAPAKSARPARARPKLRRPAGDWTPPPPREDPDFETAVRVHQKTLQTLARDVPPRIAYGNPPDEPRKARGLAVEVMFIKDLLPVYSEERLSRVAEGALLDDWTTERRAYDIKRLFAPSKARQFIDLAENGVPSKVGNLL